MLIDWCAFVRRPVVATNCHGYSWATKGCDEGGCKGQDEELLKANVAAYGTDNHAHWSTNHQNGARGKGGADVHLF